MRQFTAESVAAAASEVTADQLAGSPVLFAGTPGIAAEALQGLLDHGVQIAAVLTRPDAPVGRKRRLTPSPVAQLAESSGIPVLKADRVDDAVTAEISTTGAQLGVVVAYGALLPQPALDALPRGWVNLHYSRLPQYRGAAPVQHALLHGEDSTAATVFQLERGMDTGPIHGMVDYPIPEAASAGTVLTELTDLGTSLILALLPELLAGASQPAPQAGEPSYAPKLTGRDGFIDPSHSAEEIVRRTNATIPEPGAWTLHGEDRLKLGPVRRYQGAVPAQPGAVALLESDREPGQKAVVLTAGDAAGVVLTQVQPAGKQMMNAADWLRGQQEPVQLGGAADA